MKFQVWLFVFFISIWQAASAQSIVEGEGSTFVIDYDPAYTQPMIDVIESAAQFYADILRSPVPIHVYIDAIHLSCNSGYTNHVFTRPPQAAVNFANAPQTDVYYPSALANAYAGTDLFPDQADIHIYYNGNMINRASCIKWYLGEDMNFSYQHHSLKYETMQELAHGLGLMPLGDLMRGQPLDGKPDVFWQQIKSVSQNAFLAELSATEVETASHSFNELSFEGTKALSAAKVLTNRPNDPALLLFSRTYDAPSLTGSHMHESIQPLQLMTLNLRGAIPQVDLAIAMLEDLGWRTTFNNPAVINSQRTLTIHEDSDYTLSVADFSITDEAPESLQLSVYAGEHYSLIGNQVVPARDFNGDLLVPVAVFDDANNRTDATVTFTVTPVNDAPAITGHIEQVISEDTSLTLSTAALMINDVDSATFSLSIADGSNYSLTDNTVTPDADFYGELQVPVTVSDGEASSASYIVPVQVTPVNDAPIIVAQQYISTSEETPITLSRELLTIEDVDSNHFSLSVQDGDLYTVAGTTLTPADNFSGELTVPVTVHDGLSESGTFYLSVIVTPRNDPPVILAQNVLSVMEDNSLTLSDTDFSIEDLDGDAVSLQLLPGEHYTAVGNSLTPVLDFHGTLTANVRAFDGMAYSESFSATITVTPVNDAPLLASSPALNLIEDSSLFLTQELLDITDPDSDAFTLRIAAGEHYQVAFNEIIPAANWFGELTVGVVVNDGELDSNTVELTITVTPVNDLPELTTAQLNQSQIYRSFSQQLNVMDVDGDTLSFSLANAPEWLSISNDGVLTGMPIATDVGEHSLDVILHDGNASVAYPLTLSVLDDPTATDLQTRITTDRTIWSTSGWVPVTATLTNAGPKEDVMSVMNIGFAGEWYSDDDRCDATTGQCDVYLFNNTEILFYVRQSESGSADLRVSATHDGFEVLQDNNAASLTLTFTEGSPTSPQFTIPAFGEGNVRAIGIADIQGGRWPEILFANGPTEASTSYRFEQSLFTPVLHSHLADASDSYAMALFDADNDGDVDWVLANGNGEANTVYLNNGAGQFSLHGMLGNADSRGVAFGDIDGDGDMDLVFANGSDSNTLYWNDGEGNFTLGADLGVWESADVIIKDLNRDGKVDVLFANRGFRNRLFINRGNAHAVGQRSLFRTSTDNLEAAFGEVELGTAADLTTGVRLADFDGDGDATDIVFVNEASDLQSASVEIFTVDNSAQPQQVVRTENGSVSDIEVGDYDGDGRDDIALLRPGGALEVVQPQGNSLAVIDVLDTDGADTILLVDVDGSGKADVISANSERSSSRLDFSGEVYNSEALAGEDNSAPVVLPVNDAPVISAANAEGRKGGAGSGLFLLLSVLLLAAGKRRS